MAKILCLFLCANVSFKQTSNNKPHPGPVERGVPHVARAVDALIGKSCVVHCKHCSAIDHFVPVSHVIVVSCTKHMKTRVVL